jgi:iron complex transport system substrate-binding protein
MRDAKLLRSSVNWVVIIAGLLLCATADAATNVPQRIVSYSPAVTEMLFAIGAGERVVGVTDFCRYPAAACAVQSVGGLVNPSFEVLLTLRPDLVVVQGTPDRMQQFCARHGIALKAVRVDDWNSITNTIQELGELTGRPDDAGRVRANMTAQLSGLARQGEEVAVFVCLGRAPGAVATCTTAAAGSFIGEMLTAAGGSNVCSDVVGAYPSVAAEVLTARKPAVIFDIRPLGALAAEDRHAVALEWRKIVPGARVIVVTDQGALIPGPRVVELAAEFAQGLSAGAGVISEK